MVKYPYVVWLNKLNTFQSNTFSIGEAYSIYIDGRNYGEVSRLWSKRDLSSRCGNKNTFMSVNFRYNWSRWRENG